MWIECRESKKRCLWLHGEASTGKSAWLEIFSDIFTTSYLKFNTEKYQDTNKKPGTQLVACNDIAQERIVQAELVSEMKNFLEGKGFCINEKNGRTSMQFKDCIVVFTSNELPKMSKPYTRGPK